VVAGNKKCRAQRDIVFDFGPRISWRSPEAIPAMFIALFLVYLAFGVSKNSNANFKSTNCLHETVVYEFTPAQIIIVGESFNSSQQWSTIHRLITASVLSSSVPYL
jgi:hypothetical protein